MEVEVLVLGCGYSGSAVARLARTRGLSVLATVRSEARAKPLRDEGFEVMASAFEEEVVSALAARVSPKTLVVVAFPPDGVTDDRIAPRLAHAGAIAYVSSTGIYGERRGRIDDTTPLPEQPTERAARILAAEETWLACGATVLRCPGIYGPDRGLHVRVQRGEHRIPDDGSNFTSRIHVEDLAQLLLATRTTRGETFVVGDRAPAMQREIVAWIAEEYGVPMPPFVDGASVHETLRADRQIDPSRALAVLDVTLSYPHYRDGMARTAR